MICHEFWGILVIFQVILVRADVSELLTTHQTYSASGAASNTHGHSVVPKVVGKDKVKGGYKYEKPNPPWNELSYLPPNIGQTQSQSNKLTGNSATVTGSVRHTFVDYKQSKPRAIDDPLPQKVNYVPPIILDFPNVQTQAKPLFTAAYAPTNLALKTNIEPPTIRKSNTYTKSQQTTRKTTTVKPTTKLLTTRKQTTKSTTTTRKATTKPPTKTPPKSAQYGSKELYRPEIKYPAQIKTPNKEEDILYINHHHGPKTEFELFNYHERYALDSSPPEVIFKPGDDTSFADDLTVIDDYVHTFPPDFFKATTTTQKPKTTLKTTKKPVDEIPSSSTINVQTSKEVSKSSKQGYIYEKPKIPFHT